MGRLDLHKLLKQAAIEMSKGIIYYLTENFCRQGSAWQWSEWCGCGNCWELCYWQQLKLALEQYSLAQEVCLDNTNGFAAVFLWEMQGPSPPSAPPSAFDSQRNIVVHAFHWPCSSEHHAIHAVWVLILCVYELIRVPFFQNGGCTS